MKKGLASDFDNTLYFRDTEERMRAQDIFEILYFQQSGGIFGICTGRSPDSVRETAGKFIRPDFIIAVSGALVVDGKGKILHEYLMDRGVLEELYHMMENKAQMVIHAGGEVYTLMDVEYPLQKRIGDLSELPDSIYGLSMRLPTPEAALETAERIEEIFGDDIVPNVNVNHIDVTGGDCSKATGVKAVRKHFGIDCIGGIGDSFNDIPLLEAADIGYTFESAPKELKDAADEIVVSVADALARLRVM